MTGAICYSLVVAVGLVFAYLCRFQPPDRRDLRERYQSLTIEELADLYRYGDLTELALSVMAEVLRSRGFTLEQFYQLIVERMIVQRTLVNVPLALECATRRELAMVEPVHNEFTERATAMRYAGGTHRFNENGHWSHWTGVR